MKITISNYYSQRDLRWRFKKLGYSTVASIGNFGCLLTAYAMAAQMRPDDLNVKLRNVNGFAHATLIKHQSVAQVVNKWIFKGLIAPYNNTAVKTQITNNGFCIVKLSNGLFPEHWVVFIGGQRMIDPWSGKNEPTNKYGNTYMKYIDLVVK